MSEIQVPGNIARFSGFADMYDDVRPTPPEALLPMLVQLAQVERPALVVDVGSGTGLSTLAWADRAAQVVGVEPGDDMRTQAEQRGGGVANVSFRKGFSHDTGLPDGCADIVTISQALHWMEPASTFAEVARILRPGGIFAAYDCDWPPTMHWEAEQAYMACMRQSRALEAAEGVSSDVTYWDKDEHLARIAASNQFRFTREITLHSPDTGNAERLVRLALSQGHTATLRKNGFSEEQIGVAQLRAVARATIGDAPIPWLWSYRVRIGVR